jgi:UDP-3-O-[3-hydroxymyristoyl] glucosamine N-acyltransferase
MGRLLASPITAGAAAELIGATIRGNSQTEIKSVASLTNAAAGDITFFSDKRHAKSLAATTASVVIAHESASIPAHSVHLVHPEPHAAFATLLDRLFVASPRIYGRSEYSCIDSTAILNEVLAQEFVSIGARSWIGFHTELRAGVRIGNDVVIGDQCILHPGVIVNDGVRIGNRCIIQSGAVIGSDGFGFQPTAKGWLKVPQVGTVVIGDDVEIGANTAIDRGAIEDTVIGNGVKIDNLVQIAHNVRIGDHTAIAGAAGVAGSATIGKRCMIGGAAMIVGHIEICDDVIVSGGTLVSDSITEKGQYTAVFPYATHREWMRMAATLRRSARSNKPQNKKPDSTES